jgi:hypothetical protein
MSILKGYFAELVIIIGYKPKAQLQPGIISFYILNHVVMSEIKE